MRSFVVTGGGRGVGRAIVERLVRDGATVAVIEFDAAALDWAAERPEIVPVIGDAADVEVAARAAAAVPAPLAGWVNNAAVFRDAWLHEDPAAVADLIGRNLGPVIAGSAAALRAGCTAIVNVSSHQAQRAVRGALPYATAKAAVEGLTRATAVDYGPRGVRVNAVALGSIATERSDAYVDGLSPAATEHFTGEIAALHPLGRMGRTAEVADVVAFLLSEAASFLTGAIIPVDGGRAAQGRDPEEEGAAPEEGAALEVGATPEEGGADPEVGAAPEEGATPEEGGADPEGGRGPGRGRGPRKSMKAGRHPPRHS